jgi:hypothetical protein
MVPAAWADDGAWTDVTPKLDLGGWHVAGGAWSVEKGKVIGKAGDGQDAILLLDRDLADFDMEVEFFGPKRGEVGLILRGHELPKLPLAADAKPKGAPTAVYGYRWAIAAGKKPKSEVQSLAPQAAPAPAERAAPKIRLDELNRVRVVAAGGTVAVSLNGADIWRGSAEKFISGIAGLYVGQGNSKKPATARFTRVQVRDHGHAGKWRSLFNGTELENWVEWGQEKWSVEDGVIYGRSGEKKLESYLATKDTWKDFDIRASFKMLGQGNFGLFYHSTVHYDEKQYPIIAGVQGEVAPEYPGPSGWVYESYKRGWLVQPDKTSYAAYALKSGDWNDIEIRSAGNRITTWVNGINVVDWTDPSPNLTEGTFALQLHTGGVDGIAWKDLFVRR